MSWTEKYRPAKFSEVKGQDEALRKIVGFVNNFGKGKKAIILHGPPGTGKTTLAHVISKEINSEIFELNASDLRNREKLEMILKPAIEQKSLMKEKKIILVDEVDGISTVDRGGLKELLELVELTSYPIIITANDIWGKELSPLRKVSELVQLKEIASSIINDILIQILKKENLFVDENVLTKISVKAKGDLRAAINDLQAISKADNPFQIVLDERNKETDIFNALKTIFKEEPSNELLSILDNIDMPLDEIMLWVEENIPLEYSGEELAKAINSLSKSDIFKGRIYKQQYWRFLIYQNIFLSYGISASKKRAKRGFTNYKKPERILKIWINNQKIDKKKSITKKYAGRVHIGEKRALQEFPLIKYILKDERIRKELKLTEDEIVFLDGEKIVGV